MTPATSPTRLDVLVVEDDEATAELERRALSRAGFTVHIAGTVRAALALLKTESVSAILLDHGLPDGDAWPVLAAAMRQDPPLPVILVSGIADQSVLTEALQRGVSELAPKTESFWERLPDTVRQVIDRTRAQQARSSGEPGPA